MSDDRARVRRLLERTGPVHPERLADVRARAERRAGRRGLPAAGLLTSTALVAAVAVLLLIRGAGAPTDETVTLRPGAATPPLDRAANAPLPTPGPGPESAPLWDGPRGLVSCEEEGERPVDYRVRGYRPWRGEARLMLFEFACVGKQGRMMKFGNLVIAIGKPDVEGRPIWGVGDSGGVRSGEPTDRLIRAGVSMGSGGSDGTGYVLVTGEVLSPEVDRVEVRFDTGRTLRDNTEGDVFGLVDFGARQACELRALGADGDVVYTEDLRSRLKADGARPVGGCARSGR